MVCLFASCIGIDCGVSHMVYRLGVMQGWVAGATASPFVAGLALDTQLLDCVLVWETGCALGVCA
jgi:hypothetical protein